MVNIAAAHTPHFVINACDDDVMRVLIPVPDRDFDVTEFRDLLEDR